jgi:hypothetical protein
MSARKIIQITTFDGTVHVLCDDGSVWAKYSSAGDWYRLDTTVVERSPPPPATAGA